MKLKKFKLMNILAMLCLVGVMLFAESAMATGVTGVALTKISGYVGHSVVELAKVLSTIALVCGVAFILASFFKFHQHKLNPTQVPISQGVTLLLIGAALTVFTIMIPTAKKAVFGTAEMGNVNGSQMSTLLGSK